MSASRSIRPFGKVRRQATPGLVPEGCPVRFTWYVVSRLILAFAISNTSQNTASRNPPAAQATRTVPSPGRTRLARAPGIRRA